MIFQPDRYLLKEQIRKYAHYIFGVVLDAGGGDGSRYKSFFNFDKYIVLDIDSRVSPDIVGSVENIPLENSSIDSIVSTQCLEHVDDAAKAVQEFHRVLKPEGFCLVTAPQACELHGEPHDYFRFTKFGLKKLFNQVGFKIILIDKRGGFWSLNAQIQTRYIIDLLKLNQRPFIRKIFSPFIWLNCRLAIWIDKRDKSKASDKHAIGWLIIAQK